MDRFVGEWRVARMAWKCALCVVLFAGVTVGEDGSPRDDDVQVAISRAEQLFSLGEYREAATAFEQANALAGGYSPHCLLRLAHLYNLSGYARLAIENAEKVIEVAPDRHMETEARLELGIGLTQMAKVSPLREPILTKAEEALRGVLSSPERIDQARLYLAKVLIMKDQLAEARSLLRQYLQDNPRGPLAQKARRWMDNPVCAINDCVPEFSLSTIDGKVLRSQDIAGKVVLFDFWAPRCPPCVRDIPLLKELSESTKGRPFLLVSVTSVPSKRTLRNFLKKHDVKWPQYWDKESMVIRGVFNVRALPTYIAVDHQGVMRRQRGWTDQVRTNVMNAITRAESASGSGQRE